MTAQRLAEKGVYARQASTALKVTKIKENNLVYMFEDMTNASVLSENSYLYSCPNSEGANTESNNTSYESPASTFFTGSGNITFVGLAPG